MALALLYRETRHFTWYWASSAIRSPALSLARSGLSCHSRAIFLTCLSRSKVEALRRVSLPAGLSQMKHVSGTECVWSTLPL